MSQKPQKPQKSKAVREDVHAVKSKLPGLWGMLETFLRRFKGLSFYVLISSIALIYITCLALALIPSMGILLYAHRWAHMGYSLELKACIYALAFALAYLSFALSLIFVVPAVNKLMVLKIKPYRGSWTSIKIIPWYIHNALTQLVRYLVLDIMTPTPLIVLFYRMMGMKIGKGCIINSTNISDPCLIELGDHVTIGGSATLFAHYGMGGYLIIGKTIVGPGTTIGLKASVMGDVKIGANVTVKPHTVVLPKTKIPDGSTY